MAATTGNLQDDQQRSIRKAVPIILFFFVFALVIDNSFKLISVEMANDLGISATTVSWQATLAGLIIGIGAVVYASLADTISIRTLLSVGIIFIVIGSLMGYLFQDSFPLIIVSRIIQTAGLAAAETLYVIFVTKHLPKNEQRKFLGFSTSSYSLSMIVGSLTGGYISTYLHWTTLFLIPLLSLLILPFILKYLPKEAARKSSVDVVGLFLIGVIATSIMLYFTNFSWYSIALLFVGVVLFILYISKNDNAIIGVSFFKNKRFISVLGAAFVIYTVQLGYIFMFPFLLQEIYGLELDLISWLLIPGYIAAVIIGALSGKVAQKLSNKQTIMVAMLAIAGSLLFPAFFVQSSPIVFVISMIVFAGAFALMYAPMLDSCVSTIPTEKSGTAVGFYNLVLNIAASIGIAYTASMIDALAFSTVLIVLAIVAVAALAIYWLLVGRLVK
ncbi:MFS transporter [Oceanobacillus sp. CAU 1775]